MFEISRTGGKGMNERIKELEIQCWEPRQYGPAWFNSTKFAELIVKECLHIVDDEGAGEGGCIRAMIRIQEEFGVEE